MPIRKFGEFGGAFTEAYDIARRVELVGGDRRRYRLDVFDDVGSSPQAFSVRCYAEKRNVALPETTGAAAASSDSYEVWVNEDELPCVSAPTPEQALGSGLGFLAKLIRERMAGAQST